MSNYTNIGCITRDQSRIVKLVATPVYLELLPSSVYRIVADTNSFIDVSASGNPQAIFVNGASGVYLPANTVEFISTTEDKTHLFAAQCTASGTMFVSRVLGSKI